MEIFYTEYFCKKCGCTVEHIRSVFLPVPCKLDVNCPECDKELLLYEVQRMEKENGGNDEI